MLDFNGRVNLDLIHIDGIRAHRLGHGDALALRARGVGGHEAGQLGLVFDDHLKIRAETAGGEHNGLGV